MFDRDYEIKGKHATYTRFLRDTAGVFNRFLDVLMVGAIMGLIYGRQAKVDNSSEDTAKIFTAQLVGEAQTCEFIYRLIMLLDKSTGLAPEQCINRAFRDDTNEKAVKDNMALFNSYALGGIELLYEKFSEGCTTDDDYISRVFEFVNGYNYDLKEISDDKVKEKVEEIFKVG